MRISDWSSDVCSSDLVKIVTIELDRDVAAHARDELVEAHLDRLGELVAVADQRLELRAHLLDQHFLGQIGIGPLFLGFEDHEPVRRSEEHTSELQSLMRNSYAGFCLKKNKKKQNNATTNDK